MKDHVGFGALNEAFIEMSAGDFKRVLVVASDNGWHRLLTAERKAFFEDREVCLFSGFSPNPEIGEIMAGVEALTEFQPDLLIAYGGGSPIDVAKMMKAIAFTKGVFDPSEPSVLAVSGDGPPVAAIATTSGSGSEATQFAVYYLGNAKQSLASPFLRPEMAVADPEASYSLPRCQTAATGFDALSQAVEAYWSSSTTEDVRELSGAAIRYGLGNIADAVNTPGPGNRLAMTMSAYLSGKAINATRTTMPHALGYHLTKGYGLAHGHAVALTLPYFFRINMDSGLAVNSPLGLEGHRRNMEGLFG